MPLTLVCQIDITLNNFGQGSSPDKRLHSVIFFSRTLQRWKSDLILQSLIRRPNN